MTTCIDPKVLRERALADRELAHRLRGFTGRIALPFLDPALDISFEEGRVCDVATATGRAPISWDGPIEWWDTALGKARKPGFEHITSGMGHGVYLTGLTPQQAAAYQSGFGRLFEVIRESIHGPEAVQIEGDLFADTDNAVGRYVRVKANGQEARMFYEESGEGEVVLLMQHTAGGDARQYRHQLADPELQKRCRLIAYDLPYHGRSLPPHGVRWWEEAYKPDKEYLMNWIVGLVDALGLDRPIFMGCSVGGHLALDLAAHHHDKFRGFISLNGWYAPVPRNVSNDGFRDPMLAQDAYAGLCLDVCAPDGPEIFRQQVYWNYASNFHGIFAGDNDFFMFGHDLRKDGHLIQPEKTPVYVLVGEYDASAQDQEHGGPAVARNIPGTIYREMKGMSHFAPTDHPMGFREELIPVLDAILAHRP